MLRRIATIVVIAVLGIAAQARAQFGGVVAVAGNDVLVSEASGRAPGIVHVYRRATAGGWVERTRLTASNGAAGDGFGGRIAVDGDLVVVGARGANGGKGGAYVFRRDPRTLAYAELAQLTAPDGQSGDGFGNSVGSANGVIAVGAPQRDSVRGAVYMFRREGDSWNPAGVITAPDRMLNENYGASLALLGDRVVIGASGRDRGTGAAYVYAPGSGGWQLDARLSVPGLAENSRLGGPITMRDSLILLSAAGVDRNAGALYAFRKDSTGAWVSELALRPFSQEGPTRFSTAVALMGGDILVAAPGQRRSTGAIYRFSADRSGAFTSADLIGAAGLEPFDQFAANIAASNTVLVAGVTGDDYGAGSALVFERDRTGALRQAARLTVEAPLVAAVTGAERRCDGRAAQFDCSNVDLLAFLPIHDIGGSRGVEVNDVWGWTDPTTNKEYALVGRNNGTSFVDVTNPSRPVYLGNLPLTTGARAAIWRDIKTYQNYAYVVADGAGNHGMQVFDLTQLREVRAGAPRTFQPVMTYTHIASAHNIVINEQSGFAYAVGANGGGETCGGGLHMIDIRTPTQPSFAGCFADTATGQRHTGYSHDAQCVMYHGPDQRYNGHEICLGSNENAISIADVTDKSHPVAISNATYPNASYTHQGWLTEDQRYFYLDDELDELSGKVPGTRTLIWDLSDLRDPVLAGEYNSGIKSIDHNLYVRGNYLYEANYTSGLRVLDITDRVHPREVGFLDTQSAEPDAITFAGAWSNYPFFRSGTVLVSSIEDGLFVVRPRTMNPVP